MSEEGNKGGLNLYKTDNEIKRVFAGGDSVEKKKKNNFFVFFFYPNFKNEKCFIYKENGDLVGIG